MRRTSLALCLCLAACRSQAGSGSGQRTFRSDWSPGIERPWIGPDYCACRLQDWRLRDGRVECLAAGTGAPARTLHLLTAALSERRSSVSLAVRTGPLEPGPAGAAGLAGFLIGAGGAGIDHRITALVHGRPGPDGGLVCAVDGTGRVGFHDFEQAPDEGALAEIEATSRHDEARRVQSAGPFELALEIAPAGKRYDLTLIARAPSGRELDRATLAGVEARLVDGGLALVSHPGPEENARGHWFDDWTIAGQKLALHPDRAFGPILGVQYTLARGTLRLTAQLPPLGPADARSAELFVQGRGGRWKPVARAEVEEGAWIAPFRVEAFEAWSSIPYRVVYALETGQERAAEHLYEGVVRAEPVDGTLLLAALGDVEDFSGESGWNAAGVWFPHAELAGSVASHDPDLVVFAAAGEHEPQGTDPLALFDQWQRWYWAFRDLVRERPSITLPTGSAPPLLDRVRTSHLPKPATPGAFCADLEWGGVSFAVLADEPFRALDPAGPAAGGSAHEAGAARPSRLADGQLDFLRAWGSDWAGGTWMKVVLSSQPWADRADADAPSGDVALRELRRAFALHVCADRRPASLARYGIDAQDDAGYAFCVPPGAGRHVEPGYGLLHFDGARRSITAECWPRSVDPRVRNARPYDGWPITIAQLANYEREPVAYLPALQVRGMHEPVVQVVEEASGEVVYTLRIQRPSEATPFRPSVFALGRYTLRVGEPGTARWRSIPHVEARVEDPGELQVDL
jgi:hypothetical protein